MNVYLDEKYKNAASVDYKNVDPAQKVSEDYYLQCAKSHYASYLNGGCYTSPHTHKTFDELYYYATGGIDVDQIKPQLTGGEKFPSSRTAVNPTKKAWEDAIEKGWDNLDWSPVSPIPRIMKTLEKTEDLFDSDVRVYCLDPFSRSKEEDDKANAYVRMKEFNFLTEYSKRAGIPIDDTQFTPDSVEQLNVYAQSGGFKQAHARALESLFEGISRESDYPEIRRRHIFDLATYGVAGMRAEFDPMSGRIYFAWKNPRTSFIEQSKYSDFRDSKFAGDYDTISVNDLAVYGFDIDQRRAVALAMCGAYDNPSEKEFDQYDTLTEYGGYRWGTFKCCVMNCEWVDTDKEYRKEYTTPFGAKRYAGEKWGTKLGVKTNKRVFTVIKNVLRECTWVVGTDFVYNFGISSNIPRVDNRDVSLTYKFYRLKERSLVAQIKSFVNEYFMIWMRWQNDMATAMPDFWAVNMHMLNNVKMGKGEIINGAELIKMARKARVLPYQYSLVGKYEGGTGQPMTKVQGDVLEKTQSRSQEMDVILTKIYQLTGLDAGTGQQNVETATEARQVYAATSEVLTSIAKAFNSVRLNTTKTVEQRLQTAMMIPSYLKDAYGSMLSDYQIMILNEAKKSAARYGMDMVLKPSDAERQRLNQANDLAMQAKLINYDTWLYVDEMIRNNTNMSWIRIYVGYMVNRKKKEDFQQQQALIKQQSDGNIQHEQVKQQTQQQMFQQNGQLMQGEVQLKAQAKLSEEQLVGMMDIKSKILSLLAAQNTEESTRMMLSKELEMINSRLYA